MRAELTLHLEIGTDRATPDVIHALENLAAQMMLHAEGGLWTLGSPDATSVDGTPSLHVADVSSMALAGIVLRDGHGWVRGYLFPDDPN